MRALFIVFSALLVGVLIGNKIGWMAATEKFTREDRLYGCKVWQQAPNGDCP